MATGRVFLGKATQFQDRQRIYAIPDGLEIDQMDQYDIIRKRVYFDDVLMITRHRFYGKIYVGLLSIGAALFFLFAALAVANSGPEAAVIFAIIGLCFFVPLVVRLALAVDAITIYGRRTKAQIHFHVKKAKCEEVYRQLCELTRLKQEAIANEILAEEAELAAQQAAAMPEPPPAEGDFAPEGTSEEPPPEAPPRAPGF